MPSSYFYQIPTIIEYVRSVSPKSVLDIGFGFGKYGFLIREYLDIDTDRYGPDSWKIKLDGIDVHQPYILDTHRIIYNNIYIGEANKIMDSLEDKYDLILAIDILEHFDKDQGIAFINKCQVLGLHTLISTPNSFLEQGEFLGNQYETHKTFWSEEELENLGAKEFLPDEHSIIAVF